MFTQPDGVTGCWESPTLGFLLRGGGSVIDWRAHYLMGYLPNIPVAVLPPLRRGFYAVPVDGMAIYARSGARQGQSSLRRRQR